jgi:hypothetical protein
MTARPTLTMGAVSGVGADTVAANHAVSASYFRCIRYLAFSPPSHERGGLFHGDCARVRSPNVGSSRTKDYERSEYQSIPYSAARVSPALVPAIVM